MDVKKRKSLKQEKRTAKELNGRITPASGALWGAKGDVRSDKFLVECKTTDRNFYSLRSAIWLKIWTEAVNDGLRIPVMCIEIQDKSFAVFECGYLNPESVLSFDTKYVDAQSVRIHKNDNAFLCVHKSWRGYTDALAVMPWEDFLGVSDEFETGY